MQCMQKNHKQLSMLLLNNFCILIADLMTIEDETSQSDVSIFDGVIAIEDGK